MAVKKENDTTLANITAEVEDVKAAELAAEFLDAATAVEAKPDPNELVDVYLFEDGDKYKDDVFVAVNGKTFQIRRGENVKVPRYVKEVLDNSTKQNKAANNYMKKQQEDFENKAKKLDI